MQMTQCIGQLLIKITTTCINIDVIEHIFLEKQYFSPDSIPAAKVDWLHRISSIQQGTTKIRLSILLLPLLVHDQ